MSIYKKRIDWNGLAWVSAELLLYLILAVALARLSCRLF